MDNEKLRLNSDDLDAIGEIMNISMGAAATAISTMLDRQVQITTPSIQQELFKNIDSKQLEPAIMVKINYVEGIDGSNVIMFRRRDMQIIINLLMGSDEPIPEEDDEDIENFEFDDMSMSAACEIMNQMMGSSSTALSEILDMKIDISPPEAQLVKTKDEITESMFGMEVDEQIISVSFQLTIPEILDTTFASFMPIPLARLIVDRVNNSMDAEPEPVAPPADAPPLSPAMQQQADPAPAPAPAPPMEQAPPMMAPPPMEQAPPMAQVPPMATPAMDPAMMQQMMQQMMMQQQQMMQQSSQMQDPSLVIKNAAYPAFMPNQGIMAAPENMNLLMGVQLDVSVVIGRTTEKIKEIIEFGQGTVLELDKQTGSPAEIIVNGKLLAYGDIIVVGDNFGIRITEIVDPKKILDIVSK